MPFSEGGGVSSGGGQGDGNGAKGEPKTRPPEKIDVDVLWANFETYGTGLRID